MSPAHDRQPRQPVMVNDVVALVSHALVEVCTVPVLLVLLGDYMENGLPYAVRLLSVCL